MSIRFGPGNEGWNLETQKFVFLTVLETEWNCWGSTVNVINVQARGGREGPSFNFFPDLLRYNWNITLYN